jgi:hypothetical protein
MEPSILLKRYIKVCFIDNLRKKRTNAHETPTDVSEKTNTISKHYTIKFRIVFWDVLPCKIIVDRRFRGAHCLHHQRLMSDWSLSRSEINVFVSTENKHQNYSPHFRRKSLRGCWLWCCSGGICTGGWTKGLLLVESSMTHQGGTLLQRLKTSSSWD